MSVLDALANGLAEGTRCQGWQQVTCTPGCLNAGPFTIYGPTGPDQDQYRCAVCGHLMTTREVAP